MPKMHELKPLKEQGDIQFRGEPKVMTLVSGATILISHKIAILMKSPIREYIRLCDGWNDEIGLHIQAYSGLSKEEYLQLEVDELAENYDIGGIE